MMKLTQNQRDDLMLILAAHDFDDLPDGAWFRCLEEVAEEFIESRKLKNVDENTLVHFYLKQKNEITKARGEG